MLLAMAAVFHRLPQSRIFSARVGPVVSTASMHAGPPPRGLSDSVVAPETQPCDHAASRRAWPVGSSHLPTTATGQNVNAVTPPAEHRRRGPRGARCADREGRCRTLGEQPLSSFRNHPRPAAGYWRHSVRPVGLKREGESRMQRSAWQPPVSSLQPCAKDDSRPSACLACLALSGRFSLLWNMAISNRDPTQ